MRLSATLALSALARSGPFALPVALAAAAFACSAEDVPATPPAPPVGGSGAGTVGGQAATSGGSAGASTLPPAGTGGAGGGAPVATGGTTAVGGSSGNVAGTSSTTGGSASGGTGAGGGNATGADTAPTHPLAINLATAANQKITFTAKQLDPEAGSSTPDTFATAQESGEVQTGGGKKVQGKLVMTLGGIGTCCGQGGIGGFAVGLGFHHLVIAMQTKESSAPDEYKNVPEATRTDEQNRQMGDARMEAWDGVDRVSWLNINEHDSFAYRTAKGLAYMQQQDPGGDWAYFLNADGTVRWSDVYLVGYSYGSQTLAVVAKYVRIGRGIATSGPVNEGFPNATWIHAPSATPPERMFGLYGSSNLDTKVQTATDAGWLAPAVTVNGGADLAALMGGHQFILQGEGHGEFCAGDGGKWKALCQYAFGFMP